MPRNCAFFRLFWVLTSVFAAYLFAPPVAQAQTLADALVAAYRNSNLLEQNRALLRAADEDVVQAQARLLPVINFVTRALTNSAGVDYRVSAAVTLDWPLVDFGRGALGVELAREQVLALRAGLIQVEQQVLLRAAFAYFNLYTARQQVALRRNHVEVIEQQAEAARQRFALGDGTRTDVALAEARLAAVRSALAAAEGEEAVAREDFALAVGLRPGALAALPSLPRLPRSLDEARALARAQHPAILQAQHQVAAADLAGRIVRTERFGAVVGSLAAEAFEQRLDQPFGTVTTRSSDVTASIGYQVPLYTGGRISAAERQAIQRAEAARAALNQTVAQVDQAVASAWAQLAVARAQIDAAASQIRAAETALAAVKAEAELGTRTTLDVLDAEQDLLDAQTTRLLAEVGLRRAAFALLEATGQMTAVALNLGIPTYDVEAYRAAFQRQGRAPQPASRQGEALDRVLRRFAPTPGDER